MPRSSAAACSRALIAGEMVDRSMTIAAGSALTITPSAPNATSSTAVSSDRQYMTNSASFTASDRLDTTAAP